MGSFVVTTTYPVGGRGSCRALFSWHFRPGRNLALPDGSVNVPTRWKLCNFSSKLDTAARMFGFDWRAIAVSRKFRGSSMPSLTSRSRLDCRDPDARDGNRFGCGPGRARSLSDLGVRREGKRDRDQNLCKFEANSGLFNEDLRKFWPISAFPQQNHPKSDRLLGVPTQSVGTRKQRGPLRGCALRCCGMSSV